MTRNVDSKLKNPHSRKTSFFVKLISTPQNFFVEKFHLKKEFIFIFLYKFSIARLVRSCGSFGGPFATEATTSNSVPCLTFCLVHIVSLPSLLVEGLLVTLGNDWPVCIYLVSLPSHPFLVRFMYYISLN